jgi:hypothetical protein
MLAIFLLLLSAGYGCFYSLYLRRAAREDERNVGGMQTTRYIYAIFWEQLSRGNVLALIYVLCAAYFPFLFFAPKFVRGALGL